MSDADFLVFDCIKLKKQKKCSQYFEYMCYDDCID